MKDAKKEYRTPEFHLILTDKVRNTFFVASGDVPAPPAPGGSFKSMTLSATQW